jgi:hypothetical protein
MFGLFKFAFVAIITGALAGVASIAWPKFTAAPRPAVLEQVHNVVKNTSFGKDTANVLGISDTRPVTPVNLQDAAGQAVTTVENAAEAKAREIIAHQAIIQLVNQIDKLNPEEKQQIKTLLCQPAASPSSTPNVTP